MAGGRAGDQRLPGLGAEARMTVFMAASQVFAFLAVIVGWLRGGHPERFGAAVVLLSYFSSSQIHTWRVGDFFWATAVKALVMTLIFGWLAFRADRWWPFVTTAALALALLVHGFTLVIPDLPRDTAMSALVGLWIVIYLTVLGGIVERWLAGEPAVSGAAVWGRRCAAS